MQNSLWKIEYRKQWSFFKSGYNCSQSVVAAFADMYGFTQEQALRMGASFGGGIGRMRETCGAACGMFLVAGLETGATEATDREGKAANYAVVQELARIVRLLPVEFHLLHHLDNSFNVSCLRQPALCP